MMNKLKEIPSKNPFKVPENYFEEVNSKIISAISGDIREVKKIGFYYRFKPYLLIAASVTGFIILSYTAVTLLSTDRKNVNIAEAIYEENPETYLNDIDILTLEQNVSSFDISNEESEVSKTDIIDYLLQDNIEINDIYAQL